MGEERLFKVRSNSLQVFADSGKAVPKFNWILHLKHLFTLCGIKALWPGLDLVGLQNNKDLILAKLDAYLRDAGFLPRCVPWET